MQQFFKIKFLFLSLLFFTGTILTERWILQPETYKIDTQQIENQLHKLEDEIDLHLENFQQDYENNEIKFQEKALTWLWSKDVDNLAKRGFTIVAYKNDSLRYWSDNSLTIPRKINPQVFKGNKVIKFDNGWYAIRERLFDDVKIFGLIKLKNNYSYENKYLDNSIREEIDVPSSMKISAIPVTHGKNIKDKNGKYLFSLVPTNKVNESKKDNGLAGVLYFFSFAFLLLYLDSLFLQLSGRKNSVLILSGISIAMISLRYLMVVNEFPSFIYQFNFYSDDVYSGDGIFRYFGDFVINSIFILFFATNVFRILRIERVIEFLVRKNKHAFSVVMIGFIILNVLFFSYTSKLISQLVNNSSILFEIHSVLEINELSLIAFVVISLLVASILFFTDKFIRVLTLFTHFNSFMIRYMGFSAIVIAFISIYYNAIDSTTITFYAISNILIAIIRFFKKEYRYYTVILLIFISSVFIVFFVYNHIENRMSLRQKILLPDLEEVRDDMAEFLIPEINERIKKDTILLNKVLKARDSKDIIDYLERKYFYGFWEKYKLTVTLCGNNLYLKESNQAQSCYEYFYNDIKNFGEKLNNTMFYYIDYSDGAFTYLGTYHVPEDIDSRKMSLYIQLKSKLVSKALGYPELLINENTRLNYTYSDYSYAKYKNGMLVSKSGTYPYDLSDIRFKKIGKTSGFLKENSYSHYISQAKNDKLFVLTRKTYGVVDYIISFAYLFLFLNITVIIAILIFNHKFLLKKLKPDFKNKIQFSFFFILFITFIFFEAGTLFYAFTQYRNIQNKEMLEKIQSVLTELEHKLKNEKDLTTEWKSDKYDNLDELLVKFTQVFFSDINLYDINGYLLATSRPEIFERGLIGKQMNGRAYTELALNKKAQFIQEESIGTLSYASVYIPFRNKENKIIAYINLPYFSNNFSLQENISNLLITTLNIYVVLFLITIVIAFVISTKITAPLRMLQSKFQNIELGKKHQEISYDKEDEIGELVKSYNKMTGELEKSIKKLAESERESAWREMAKQIAHEIKNPLTPMKLSVQLLQRSWKDNKEDFDKRLERVSETIIEQIDTLSSIASEFSAFAKMPKAQNEEMDIVGKIRNVVQLFENTKDVDISLETHGIETVMIIADKEQLSRVFINIIKNGIQSVPSGVYGKIYVELTTYGNTVKITIEDNGAGIADDKKDKLFKPSFTTKTKGMGMGLAIVKNIVLNANGEIWFESEVGKGTKFFVEFPIAEG